MSRKGMSLLGLAGLAAAGATAWILVSRAQGTAPRPARPVAERVRADAVTLRAPTRQAPRCRPGWRSATGPRIATYGVARSGVQVLHRPGGRVLARLGKVNANGAATVLEVVAVARDARCRALWYRVQLPLRPNGSTGYVRPAGLALGTLQTRILVELASRRLTLFRSGLPVLRTAVAIGAPATPTPTGRFYVNQRLIPLDPGGPFGPGAIGISAFSNVLTGWAQGGPVAIHGTNAPWSIGHAVSNGCIRVRNGVLRRLFAAAPAGTPVTIQP